MSYRTPNKPDPDNAWKFAEVYVKKSIFTACLTLTAVLGCASRSTHLTEAQVLAAAEPAMKARFPDGFDAHRPYCAQFNGSTWWVHGTLPTNTLDGTAEAQVEDGTGRVLKIWRTQ